MQKLFAVYDTVAATIIGGIMLQPHDGPAIRIFRDALSQADGPLAKHPDDYQLLRLGDIDDDGMITPRVELIANGSILKELTNG